MTINQSEQRSQWTNSHYIFITVSLLPLGNSLENFHEGVNRNESDRNIALLSEGAVRVRLHQASEVMQSQCCDKSSYICLI